MRRPVAVLCIAFVVCAAFVPGAAPALAHALFVPLWDLVPETIVGAILSTAVGCDEQPISLLSLALSRAPPLESFPRPALNV
jgi:hypothetical protein